MRKVLPFFFILSYVNLYSQVDSANKIGATGGYTLNIHSTNFTQLPNIPNCCPNFSGGNGSGIYMGGYFEHALSENFALQWRVSYMGQSALLKSSQQIIVDVNSVPVQGTFEHSIESTISSLGIEPSIRRSLWGELSASLGARLGMFTQSSFSQKEQITNPIDRGVFPVELKRVRNEFSGSIPDRTDFIAGLKIGIQYALPLTISKTLYIVPEISYQHSFTPIIKDYSWFAHSLIFSAGLQWRFRSSPEMPKPIPLTPDTVPQKVVQLPKQIIPAPNLMNCSISVSEILPDSTEKPVNTITVEQRRSRHLRPLLNYVFFDEDRSELHSRYVRTDPLSFNMEDFVNKSTLDTYHSILNIIGWRMQKRRDATLTVVGCNTYIRNEKNNRILSEARAKVVAAYLTDVWKIEKERIIYEIRNLPQIPSGLRTEEGLAENRRVELKSNIEEIIDPVSTVDTLLYPTPGTVTFRPAILAKNSVKRWKFSVSFQGKDLYFSQGITNVTQPFTLDLNSLPLGSLQNGEKVTAYLEVEDNDGKICTSVAEPTISILTIRQKLINRKVDISRDRYSLILFDYAQSGLSASNKKIMDEVKASISSKSEVVISGHTDRIGSDESNLKLSERRAAEVGRYIGALNTKTFGKGKRDLLYDNDLPEGRFYCRTVMINATNEFNK